MKKKLVFATNNPHKLEEIRAVVGSFFEIISLDEAGFSGDIPEDHDTLRDNALQKASFIKSATGLDCFADDTGLEIDALDGRPGVYSARYAGPQCLASDNIAKVMDELTGEQNREARFKTIIALILDGREHFFEGVAQGQIITEKRGKSGFGYDPIFLPEGYDQTFAEMDAKLKNKISHRSRAMTKLIAFLNKKA
jgi:XTP/dITP diphosphohydrolase